jgi:hypothetical protein
VNNRSSLPIAGLQPAYQSGPEEAIAGVYKTITGGPSNENVWVDGAPRPMEKIQYSLLHLMMMEESCTCTPRLPKPVISA